MEYILILSVLGVSIFSTMEFLGISISWEREEDKLYNYYKD